MACKFSLRFASLLVVDDKLFHDTLRLESLAYTDNDSERYIFPCWHKLEYKLLEGQQLLFLFLSFEFQSYEDIPAILSGLYILDF
jgi:hypothetical protein